MRRRVQRWGNSIAVRLPADVVAACDLREGSPVEVQHDGTTVHIVPVGHRHRYRLEDLVRGITRRNRHSIADWGSPVGNEVW
jgi:antitoxin component of MazEF toxin-antitoxin module